MEARGPIRRDVELRASPDEVWAALVDDPGVWFGGELTIEPHRGGAVRWRAGEGPERRGIVIELEPARRLVFRWRELEGAGLTGLRAGPASVVMFELEPLEDVGTRLTVTDSPGDTPAEGDAGPGLAPGPLARTGS